MAFWLALARRIDALNQVVGQGVKWLVLLAVRAIAARSLLIVGSHGDRQSTQTGRQMSTVGAGHNCRK